MVHTLHTEQSPTGTVSGESLLRFIMSRTVVLTSKLPLKSYTGGSWLTILIQ